MGNDEANGGPNHLAGWRRRAGLTQAELADLVGTNANMISYLEGGGRQLSAKWLRRLAPHLKTTPGHLLDLDPATLDDRDTADVFDFWTEATARQRRQITDIARTIVRTGTDDKK